MNTASILVLGIVVGLLTLAIICSRKSKGNECSGNCNGCAFQCYNNEVG